MEAPVSGIRETFFRDASLSYQRDAENSFLYRYFWQDSVRDLAEKYLPHVRADDLTPKDAPKIKAQLSAAMEQGQADLKSLLLRDPPGEGKKERRDFWQELMLNDAGYHAKLLSDTDYYIWLIRYLAARDIYYKDTGPWNTNGPMWLDRLLTEGLGKAPKESPRSKAQTERDLQALAKLLDRDNAAVQRLHNLRLPVERNGKVLQLDYLLWLTARLEKAAMHNKIRTWLQDSGYPLRTDGAPPGTPKGPRKQDFSLRILNAFCESPEGYSFAPRQERWMLTAQEGWVQTTDGFFVLDSKHLDALLAALRKREAKNQTAYFYLPLAVHPQSGCVFFLGGKAIYGELYQREDRSNRDAYANNTSLFTFDYLRVNRAFFEDSPGAGGGPFRLKSTYHENAGRPYKEVLEDYKRYCVAKVMRSVREFNLWAPADTPDLYRWGFEISSSSQRSASRDAKESFLRAQSKPRPTPQGLAR